MRSGPLSTRAARPRTRDTGIRRSRAHGWSPSAAGDRSSAAGLYQDTLGIARDDRDGRAAHHRRNYAFFGAPVGLIVTVSADMGAGAFVDAGLFLQALMLLARAEDLDTCAQASFVDFDPVIRGELSIPDDRIIVCGISLGYADDTERVNAFRSDREPLDAVVTFVGE